MTVTSLWRNSSGNVVANSNWSCLLFSASDWRVQPIAVRRSDRFKNMHGALRALHVSLNSASIRTVRKWLKKNDGHLINLGVTLQIWMPWRYHVWWATHEALLKPSSEGQNSFRIKNRTVEDMGQFSAGPINKVIPSSRNSLATVRKRWRGTLWPFLSTQKSVYTTVFALWWIVETAFDNASHAKLP